MSPIGDVNNVSDSASLPPSGVLEDVRNYARDQPKRMSRNDAPVYKPIDHRSIIGVGMKRSIEKPKPSTEKPKPSTEKPKRPKTLTPRRKKEIFEFLTQVLENPNLYGATEENGGHPIKKVWKKALLTKLRALNGGRILKHRIRTSDVTRWLRNKHFDSLVKQLKGRDESAGGISKMGFAIPPPPLSSSLDSSSSDSSMDTSLPDDRGVSNAEMPNLMGSRTRNVGTTASNIVFSTNGSTASTVRRRRNVNALVEGLSEDATSSRTARPPPPMTPSPSTYARAGSSVDPLAERSFAAAMRAAFPKGAIPQQQQQSDPLDGGQVPPEVPQQRQQQQGLPRGMPSWNANQAPDSEVLRFFGRVREDLDGMKARYTQMVSQQYHVSLEVYCQLLNLMTAFTTFYMNPDPAQRRD